VQAARNALRAEDSILQLKKDWMSLDLHTVFAHTLYAVQPLGVSQQYIEMVPECTCVYAVYMHLDYGVLESKWLAKGACYAVICSQLQYLKWLHP